MENKEVAVTAYILATESKSLTDIANKLAAAQGIQNFDTMYDNGLNRMQLENGLSASKLMAEVDDDVVEARTNVQNARTKYNSSVKKANDSIDEANKKKEEMEELRKKIVKKSGEDTSKWDDDDIEAYNKAIEEYNEANKAANAAHKEALANKELLDDAESTLAKVEEEATQKYMDQNQGTVEGVQQRPEETDVSTATPDVDELQPSVDSPTVETVESHPGELTTDDVSEIVNADTSSGSPSPKQTVFKSLDPTQDEVVHNDSKTLAREDVLSLFDDLDDVATITDADRTLESFDLSALSAGERVLPGTELSDVISGDTKGTLAMGILPQDGGNAVVSSGNSMVDLAESVASQGNSEMNSFQDLRFNSLGNGYADVSGEAAYTSNETESEEEPEKPKTRESESSKDVAGIQVEQEESARHTDGVLVEEEPVASEVSDDGRSLEFVEID